MTEVKGDAHLEQSYKDNLKYYKNDLTLKNNKQKTKPVKKLGQSNKKGNGVEQNGITECNQTSTSGVQEDMEVESQTLNQIAINEGNDNQQDSDVSSIATVAEAANKKRKRVIIKLRPKKKGKKTKKNSYEVVPNSTSENDLNVEVPQNLSQRSERDSGLEGLRRHEDVNQQINQQQNNDAWRRSRRKKRPTKFNGLVYVALKLTLVFLSKSLKCLVR